MLAGSYHHTMLRILTALLLTSALAYAAAADQPPAPDFSTPKLAAKSFFNAVETGDTATIRSAMYADDDAQRKLVDAFTDVIAASGKLASAAREKFGAPGDALGMTAIPKEEAARIDKAEEKIDGDNAALVISDRPVPMKFRKVGGAWRLIVTDFAGAAPGQIDSQINVLTRMAQFLNETAADISSGKHLTADQARSAFEERFNAAMIKKAISSTRPAR